MVEKTLYVSKALWWLPSFPWPYRRFDLSDKRNGKDSNAMYCSPFAIFLCIVYRWWVIKRFCNLMTILCVVFVEWFIPCPNNDLWFLSVRTICRTILWSNIQLTMFILSQYYTYALSNVAITFIEWFIPYCFASSWRYQVVQILTLFDHMCYTILFMTAIRIQCFLK